jgi:hypothetical protein
MGCFDPSQSDLERRDSTEIVEETTQPHLFEWKRGAMGRHLGTADLE